MKGGAELRRASRVPQHRMTVAVRLDEAARVAGTWPEIIGGVLVRQQFARALVLAPESLHDGERQVRVLLEELPCPLVLVF